MSITATGIRKAFGTFTALNGVDLEIASGELIALLGPSGSGKTSLLRIIAGLERADAGSVSFSGRDQTGIDAKDRGVGFVFQHYALFRHMTVAENIGFGLSVRPRATRPPADEIARRVAHLLEMVQLTPLGNRLPSELSGGQRQRVALARALAVEPRVLLLDEPFGALDAQVRAELRRWLRRMHDQTGVTTVFVTHDQEEALELADRVVVMNAGRIEQIGTPDAVYQHPATPFVHRFLGQVNVFHGRANEQTLVRPHELSLARAADDLHRLPARVTAVNAAGALVRVDLERDGQHLEARLAHDRARTLSLAVGDTVYLGFVDARTYTPADYHI